MNQALSTYEGASKTVESEKDTIDNLEYKNLRDYYTNVENKEINKFFCERV